MLHKSATAGEFVRGNLLGMASSRVQKKWLLYLLWMLLCVLVFWKPAYALFNLAEQDETASHILLIPFIAAWLVYTEQKQ